MAKLKFMLKSESSTPHVIGKPFSDVFVSDEQHSNFLPLVSVNLSKINPSWEGEVHFIYGGGEYDGNVFKIVNNRKLEYAGAWCSNQKPPQIEVPTDFDEDYLEDVEVEKGFVEFVDLEISDEVKLIKDKFDYMDGVMKYTEPYNKKLEEKSGRNYLPGLEALWHANQIGGRVVWTQDEVEPVTPGGAKDIFYIGQLRADSVTPDICDFDIYLFYCPSEKVQITIMQCT